MSALHNNFVPVKKATTGAVITRGVFGGSASGTMDYITIQTLGNALDFGDLTVIVNGGVGACADATRGVFAGGFSGSNINVISYVTIQTLGNAADFGDLTAGKNGLGGLAGS